MFKNLTIRTRLITMVAILSTLMILMAGGGIYSVNSSNNALHTVYEDRLVPVGQLDLVIRAINRVQLLATTALVKGEGHFPETGDAIKAAIEEESKVWKEYMSTKLTTEEEAIAAQAETAMKVFNTEISSAVLVALAAKDSARLQELVRDKMPPLYQSLRKPINELIKLQLSVARSSYDESVARYKVFLGTSIAALVAGLILGAGVAAWLIRSVTTPINHAVEIAESVAAGNLTHTVHIDSNDETARLLNALKEMQNRLTLIVSDVRAGTDSINTASREIAVGNNDLSARTEDQAASLEETASSMEELTSTVKQNADNARQANQLASSASEHAAKGGEVVQEMVQTMDAIRDRSDRIVDIISVIDGIAFQTNILALNAAVEAARAGEQGRGFAVVASEVRNLAQRSASAAKEIKQLISSAVEEVGRGTTLMDQTGSTMEQIVISVKQVADIINEISAASREQSEGIDQINQAIAQIDEATQQNAALVEESAAAAQSMQDQAAGLSQAVSVFRVAASAPAPAVSVATTSAKPAPAKLAPRSTVHRLSTSKGKPATSRIPAALAASDGNDSWGVF